MRHDVKEFRLETPQYEAELSNIRQIIENYFGEVLEKENSALVNKEAFIQEIQAKNQKLQEAIISPAVSKNTSLKQPSNKPAEETKKPTS